MHFGENISAMITEEKALQLAHDWISAWNAHDIDAIMEHYDENIVFKSPKIIQVTNDPTGTISNKPALKSYFERAFVRFPDLHFELYKTLVSIDSVVLYYKSVDNMVAAEFMELGANGKVARVCAHYAKI